MFGQSVIGSIYRVNDIVFRVLDIEPYPKDKVSKQYLEVLKFQAGVLVAVPYRGILIPNITLTGGVARLKKVEASGNVYSTPKAISDALGVKEAMYPYDLLKY